MTKSASFFSNLHSVICVNSFLAVLYNVSSSLTFSVCQVLVLQIVLNSNFIIYKPVLSVYYYYVLHFTSLSWSKIFQVFMAMNVKFVVFLDVGQCSLL